MCAIKQKFVLIACEESQVECIAFRNAGFAAFSCDLQSCSGGHPEWHIKCDVTMLLNGYCAFRTQDNKEHAIYQNWDLIIAHPPCTYLAKSSSIHMFPGGVLSDTRFEKAMKAKMFFLTILHANCKYIAIENPTPLRVVDLPPYSFACNPHEFGEEYSKRTCFWVKNLPPLMPTLLCSSWRSFVLTKSTGKGRSKSFKTIANAMVEQWGCCI